jgi:hypothetical protein
MGTTSRRAARADLDQIAAVRREIRELTDAWTRRHLLHRGTPEYVSALETEERLVTRIWRRFQGDDKRISSQQR